MIWSLLWERLTQKKSVFHNGDQLRKTIQQTVDYLNKNGRKVGFLNIHLYRPFPIETLIEKLPDAVRGHYAVLDRSKEPGAGENSLLLDVQKCVT